MQEVFYELSSLIERGKRFSLFESGDEGVDRVNSLKIGKREVKYADLIPAPVDILTEFFASLPDEEEKSLFDKARNIVKEGRFAIHLNFGGGATRLGLGPMFFVKPKELAKAALEGSDQMINRKLREYFENKRFSKEEIERFFMEIREPYEELRGFEDKGMGPTQLITYNLSLKMFAKKYGIDEEEILNNIPIILHINEEILKDVTHNLIENRFYGFNPLRIYIIVAKLFRGYRLKKDYSLELDPKSPLLPAGHGHALEQIVKENQVLVFREKSLKRIRPSLLKILSEEGVLFIRSQRINDLTMWTEDVLGIRRLSYFIHKAEKESVQIGIELVDNPKGQKGGSFVRLKGKEQSFLAETISLKAPHIKGFLERVAKERLPYNAFRNFYTVDGLKDLLSSHKLPRYLRCKEKRFYLELVSGDITQFPGAKTAAFRIDEKETIHDFKEFRNLPEALRFLLHHSLLYNHLSQNSRVVSKTSRL